MHREKNLENKKALTQASINDNISMLQIVEKLLETHDRNTKR